MSADLWSLAKASNAQRDALEPALVQFVKQYSTAAELPDEVFTEQANTQLMKFLATSLAAADSLGWNASSKKLLDF
jgi:hypothetical protein